MLSSIKRLSFSGLMTLAYLLSLMFLTSAQAELKPRKSTKWDKLYSQADCLPKATPLFKVKNYRSSVAVKETQGWISNKTGEPTVNPFQEAEKAGNRTPGIGYALLNGEGRCPDQLSYRWSRDISWTRANGEKVTATIQRTHKCRDTQPNELFTKQKVFVNVETASGKKKNNLSNREEDELIAEGLRSFDLEAQARLDATELDYSNAKKADARSIYNTDKEIKSYINPGNCSGDFRSLAQDSAEKRFCAAREAALRKSKGSEFSERDAICPLLATTSTRSRIDADQAAALECGRTFIAPAEYDANGVRSNKVETSYCPLKPSYDSVKVGDTDGQCEVKDKDQYQVTIRCLRGSIPRVPGDTSPAAVAPATSTVPATSAPTSAK